MIDDTIFEKLERGYGFYSEFYNSIVEEEIYEKDDLFRYYLIEKSQVAFEFDQFVKEQPLTCRKYLNQFLGKYSYIQSCIPTTIIENNKVPKNSYILKFCNDIDFIVEHIQYLLKHAIQDQINQPTQVLQKPKGQSKLSREQTSLLFFYLRQNRIIAQASNGSIAHAVSILTGHSEKQIEDIIKSPGTPAYQLGKDNNNKVTRNDFKSLISELKDLIRIIENDYREYSDEGELR